MTKKFAPLFAGYATAWNIATHDGEGDVIGPGSFAHLIASGKFAPRMLFGHEGEEIGRWLQFSEDEIGLLAVGRLDLGSVGGRRAFEMIEAGEITGLSRGANMVCLARPIPGTRSRYCKRVFHLGEISLVRHPANPRALLLNYTAGTA
ncbi:MAG: HK97 family phage prohead protease [Mesorhizobium sp.]|uniref:HK97 family phage prohead protease n=1 Tax=Mesorhizobium sp. TaxID=1871066 RepID=UPI000FE47E6B|nr:HK97 family phage prohead protease [Mesorhizobium sp.]RWF41842.1 MAG: HK97 family phage prohead protease [Mesorhizobium sp.]